MQAQLDAKKREKMDRMGISPPPQGPGGGFLGGGPPPSFSPPPMNMGGPPPDAYGPGPGEGRAHPLYTRVDMSWLTPVTS